MKASKSASRFAIVLAAFAVLVAVVTPAQAASHRPAGMTKAEYQALTVRGEALNERYGNAVTRLSPAEFAALWQAGGYRLEPQELVALIERSEALNRAHAPVVAVRAATSAPSDASGFAWGDFALGVAVALGVVLLAGGLVAGGRYGRRLRAAAERG
jgi:hypothetical protein